MQSPGDSQKFQDQESMPASHRKSTVSFTASPPRLREQLSTEKTVNLSLGLPSRKSSSQTDSLHLPRSPLGPEARSAFSTSCKISMPSPSGSGSIIVTSLPSKGVAMPEFSQVAILRSSPELNFATTTTRSEDRRESQPDSIGASTPQTGPQDLLPTVVTPQITTAECGKKSSASPRMSECEVWRKFSVDDRFFDSRFADFDKYPININFIPNATPPATTATESIATAVGGDGGFSSVPEISDDDREIAALEREAALLTSSAAPDV